jgi:hypothetical protein
MFIKIQLFHFFSLTRPRVPCIFDQIIIVIKETFTHNLRRRDVKFAVRLLPALVDNFLRFLCNFGRSSTELMRICGDFFAGCVTKYPQFAIKIFFACSQPKDKVELCTN